MTRSLWDVLGAIADRRGRKGRQFPLQAVLAIAISAMLAGANDLRAIFRWGRRLKPEALALFGIERAPSVGRQTAARELRRRGRLGGGGGAHRRPHSPPLAACAHSGARRQRFRAGGADGLVRGKRRALSVRAGEERSAHRRNQDRA